MTRCSCSKSPMARGAADCRQPRRRKVGGLLRFRLPRPLGYGVSVTVERGVVCIGGSDSQRHYADVFLLEWRDGRIATTALPPLPKPCANACGALVGKVIYVAGGIERPDATTAMKTFWKLDLAATEPQWETLTPWPGPERMLAVAGNVGDSFCIFSGAKLTPDADGKAVREFLRDAYRFTPGKGWTRLADMPRPAVAAPSPALAIGIQRLLIATGDDGARVNFTPVREHPGFPRDVLVYECGERCVERGGGGAILARDSHCGAMARAVCDRKWRGASTSADGRGMGGEGEMNRASGDGLRGCASHFAMDVTRRLPLASGHETPGHATASRPRCRDAHAFPLRRFAQSCRSRETGRAPARQPGDGGVHRRHHRRKQFAVAR